ncbi:MAG: hypothetical protein EZS28_019384 [Streblomastix strix]|uniref:Uncharacterized protein n=1 Tax=Streblomastix strix TaxID=222440 RepID=A0A5J4VRS8_9EUKA|nr:MAG: hypothetical protein EZS28_019384 [Streblomastix strix]
MNPEKCTYKTPLQVTYFILDNVKYWYLNSVYNFKFKCLDLEQLHFIEGDIDSTYWAVSGNIDESYKQRFKYDIMDQQFYNENTKYFFPSIENDLQDEKKILVLAIERDGTKMIALTPKNYYIKINGSTLELKLQLYQFIKALQFVFGCGLYIDLVSLQLSTGQLDLLNDSDPTVISLSICAATKLDPIRKLSQIIKVSTLIFKLKLCLCQVQMFQNDPKPDFVDYFYRSVGLKLVSNQ